MLSNSRWLKFHLPLNGCNLSVLQKENKQRKNKHSGEHSIKQKFWQQDKTIHFDSFFICIIVCSAFRMLGYFWHLKVVFVRFHSFPSIQFRCTGKITSSQNLFSCMQHVRKTMILLVHFHNMSYSYNGFSIFVCVLVTTIESLADTYSHRPFGIVSLPQYNQSESNGK